MSKKIKLGFIGCGRIAAAHREACYYLESEVVIEAVAGRRQESLDEFCLNHFIKNTFTDYHDLLALDEIDGVIVSLPYYLNEEVVIDALKAGKHVLVEKPMALSYTQAKRMVDTAEMQGKILMVGQSRRFSDAAMTMKKMIEVNEIDELFRMVINFLVKFNEAPTPWWNDKDKVGQLIILLQASHSIDNIIWLFDRLPQRVYASSFSKKFTTPDEADIMLDFGDGNASIHLSLNTKPNLLEIHAIGADGTIKLTETPLTRPFRSAYRLEKNGEMMMEGPQEPSNYSLQLKEFINSIKENRQPIASGKEILQTMRVIDAVIESINNNKVVELETLI